ncbi:MAG TPA: xylulokinase [Terriglobales bacterium]|nr:xylulokinase [Terriglobales bacterium]
MKTLVAGVDCSTQSTKVVVIDSENGEIVATGRAEHTVTGTEGARETHPDIWWKALCDAIAQTGLAGRIEAISVAGQQHGLVCLDASGRPLRPAMLWNDTRSATDAIGLLEALGGASAWATRIGVVPVASFTASKWAWVRRREPEVASRTAAIRLPHDYLTERLAGMGVTDRGDASGTGWWSTKSESYATEVLGLPGIELPVELLPRVHKPTEAAGVVTAAGAASTGLPAGSLVGPGTGDNMGAALGLGLRPGTPVISLGTSGAVYMVSATRIADPSGDVAGFADATGRFLPLAATLNCTLAVDRTAEWLGLDRDDVVPSRGVVALPYFDGERTPNLPDASAAVLGLRHDTDPRSILMATYEGAVIGLLDALETIDRCSSGIDPQAPLVLIGGGARSEIWRGVVQRLSGRAISIPKSTELVAIGAAVQAAATVGGQDPQEVASRWHTSTGMLLEPMPLDVETISRHRSVRQLALDAVRSSRSRR